MTITSYAKQFEDIILWNVFKDIKNGFYVDVGAADPEINSVTKLFYDNGWTGVNVEPSYQFFYKYLETRTNDINLNIALGNEEFQKIEFYEILDTDISTTDKKQAEQYKNIFSHKIISKTLKEVCTENNINQIDFLKINSNGSDLKIIEGHNFNIIRPIVILINSKNTDEQKQEIDNILKSHNYELVLQSGNNLFYLANEHKLLATKFVDPIYFIEDIRITEKHKLTENLAKKINQYEDDINDLSFVLKQVINITKKKILNLIESIVENTKYLVIKSGLLVKRNLRLLKSVISNKKSKPVSSETLIHHDKEPQVTSQKVSKQIFIDVSEFSRVDHKTGIQRLVRNILNYILNNPIEGYKVEPVYGKFKKGYFYARNFTNDFLNLPKKENLVDEAIKYNAGDIFLGLDYSIYYVLNNKKYLKKMHASGVKVYFNINDFLPIKMPQYFPMGVKVLFQKWLELISEMDGVVCISNAVANDFYEWKQKNIKRDANPFKISWYHLGANINANIDTQNNLSADEKEVINVIKSKRTFLMVSTLEPRKGHEQTLLAFEKLWDEGLDVNLVIVGKEGWKVSQLINRIKNHKELGKRLFWLKQVSDDYLNELYKNSSCLLVASEGEGFGLPVIEAQLHNIPVLARDLMVFREVSQGNTFYFKDSQSPDVIFFAVRGWLNLEKSNRITSSNNCKVLTWDESAKYLLQEISI